MKIALGMITRNERVILQKTLIHALPFQHRYAIDFFSGDLTVELLGSFGFLVHSQEWVKNYAHARNILIQYAEEAGMDAMVMLDADEAMTPRAIEQTKLLLETHEAIAFPRIEFVEDYHHYDPTLMPDYQVRAFRLNRGYYFKGKIHEALQGVEPVQSTILIHHYGKLKSPQECALKYINYDRLSKGMEPLEQLPMGYDVSNIKLWRKCELYPQPHPLEKTWMNS